MLSRMSRSVTSRWDIQQEAAYAEKSSRLISVARREDLMAL
jgi:hypothetical protein